MAVVIIFMNYSVDGDRERQRKEIEKPTNGTTRFTSVAGLFQRKNEVVPKRAKLPPKSNTSETRAMVTMWAIRSTLSAGRQQPSQQINVS